MNVIIQVISLLSTPEDIIGHHREFDSRSKLCDEGSLYLRKTAYTAYPEACELFGIILAFFRLSYGDSTKSESWKLIAVT